MMWRKSSYSDGDTNCVEVAWVKSSYSSGDTNCVEVARGSDRVGVRDSKNPSGPVLVFPVTRWSAFLTR